MTKTTERNEYGRIFEERVATFFRKLGFQDVESRVWLGEDEVDVLAGFDETLFIVECRAKSERRARSIRSDIRECNGKLSSIKRGVKKHPIYSKYSKFKVVLALKNVDYNASDESYAKNNNVHLWDENVFEFYEAQSKSLGEFVTYNLLGEVGIKPNSKMPLRIPAFETKMGKYKLYSFLIEPRELLKFCYVARRERGSENYYQRIIQPQRIREVSEYVKEGGFFPNNAIVSIEGKTQFFPEASFEKSEEKMEGQRFGMLQFPRDYRSMWVIDGQHRLFSYALAPDSNGKVLVVAFENLPLSEQMRFFIDINENQKSVPANLIWDLHGETRPHEEEGIISNAVKDLNRNGVFYGEINIPLHAGSSKGPIKLSAICIAMRRSGLARKHTKSHRELVNPLYTKDPQKLQAILTRELKRYFEVLKEELGEEVFDDMVLDNSGIAILIYVYEKLLFDLKREKVSKWGDIISAHAKVLKKQFTPQKVQEYRQRASSEAGRTAVAQELFALIATNSGDEELIDLIEMTDFGKEVSKLERELAAFVDKKVNSIEVWSHDRMSSLYENIARRMKKKGTIDKRSKMHEFITFGEIRGIFEKEKGLFDPIFLEGSGSFTSKEEFFGSLDRLSSYRNPVQHGAVIELTQEDEQLGKMHIARIRKKIAG